LNYTRFFNSNGTVGDHCGRTVTAFMTMTYDVGPNVTKHQYEAIPTALLQAIVAGRMARISSSFLWRMVLKTF